MPANMDHLNLFIKFAAKELGIKALPKIHFVGSSENKMDAFGHTNKKDIYVRVTDRHPIDIMRTIAHELIHCGQKSGSDKWKEDNANEMAGRLMRKFDIKYPHVFKDKAVKANMMEDGMAANAVGAGGMGASSSGPIQGFDPLLKPMLKRKPIINKVKGLRDIIGSDYKNDRKSDKR